MKRIIGSVLWYDKRDGQGLVVDAKGNEYYIDESVLEDYVKSGDSVSWLINPSIQHVLCGMDVTLLKE